MKLRVLLAGIVATGLFASAPDAVAHGGFGGGRGGGHGGGGFHGGGGLHRGARFRNLSGGGGFGRFCPGGVWGVWRGGFWGVFRPSAFFFGGCVFFVRGFQAA